MDLSLGTPSLQKPASISAIVVTYQPDLVRLRVVLAGIVPQVNDVYVVDNGDGRAVSELVQAFPSVTLIALGENQGIGAAQNAGAAAALAAGASHLLLLDQDSIPDARMASILHDTFDLLLRQGYRVAAVGPASPSRSAPASFVRVGWFGYRVIAISREALFVWCDVLIASGLMISAEAWSQVGPMNEALFIDKVDTEWCLRAKFAGFRVAGVPATRLDHSLGEHHIKLWLGRWKYVPVHRPFRYYYIVRNGLLLTRSVQATWKWRTAEIRYTLQALLFFAVVPPGRRARIRFMMRGLLDGVRSRVGRA